MKPDKTIQFSRFYALQPDFTGPAFRLPADAAAGMHRRLEELYGTRRAKATLRDLERIMGVNLAYKTDTMRKWEKSFDARQRFAQDDVILITYGDLITNGSQAPLAVLADISRKYFQGVFNTIHILPFFPSSSDRGFAIRDFTQVDPGQGRWRDINRLKDSFKLMFDGVINHVSSKSHWFQEFLNGNPEYTDFFISYSDKAAIPEKKLKMLMRPRTSSVLTPFHTYGQRRLVWTTFSADQIDLKFQNPKVLLKIIEVLLTYVRRGADIIRLDAVTYLWSELGTSGAHMRQTHVIIKLLREVLNIVAPHVALITETNVPHKDNITYFGDGSDEAQMVYNFALPPLVLHALYRGDATVLSTWADSLKAPSDTTTFFNFLDSHDGIGLLGVKDILSDADRDMMVAKVKEHGGLISYRTETDGSQTPYEMNITFYSALNRDGEKLETQVKRYCAARAVALIISGVPGIYLHGFLGSRNDLGAIKRGDENRSINRMVLDEDTLVDKLENSAGKTHAIASALSHMIKVRINEPAFHPRGAQTVLRTDHRVFAVVRTSPNRRESVLALVNVTPGKVVYRCPLKLLPGRSRQWQTILSNRKAGSADGMLVLTLHPYDVVWLKKG